ncbi:MAG TPA: MFS transporter [Bacteroidales bacterium]|nr:MFS transporter [Bacteroidales bacterium]
MDRAPKEKLLTPSFFFACFGNFLLFFGFYLLLPVLPVYLMETFHATSSQVGLILSCYVVAALSIRPFSGFLADRFQRKTVYLLGYGLFVAAFIAYPMVETMLLFVLLRVLHGLTFGMVTTSGNTLIVDIMPSSRRGEGLGYFGIANNLAMAAGPMIGLMLLDAGHSYNMLFYTALICGIVGYGFAANIKAPIKPRAASEPLSFDRFFLKKGLLAGVSLLLMAIPYGITTSYIALYAKVLHIHGTTGLFFSLMALGLIASRTFAGKLIDRGKLVHVIVSGQTVIMLAFGLFGLIGFLTDHHLQLVSFCFFLVSFLLGVGYGMIFPAYNTLFVDLAPNNRRATASSTYLTSWDLGIGIGLVFGANLSGWLGFPITYEVGTILVLVSTLFFLRKAGPSYLINKLR